MPNGYLIARITVTEPEAYGAYAQALPAVVARFGGRFLVAGGRLEAVAGEARPRNVVIVFDDYETARACWHSPDYAEVARLREGAATVDVVIVEGVDP
ncbi:DUF1330 domain-containing protein [Methylobacterium goesingense]|uniref:Uncharacterized protein (DUF1330 family) n=1 Tax=Methylobacterium goesingense TaxID=243690 RepID=A0ABV2L6E3_9HYPH|nr:DUF1330 domain-containing protein [Methylobacterium goesingense]GJD72502.1 hypothetical protein CFIICLFH_0716 [Methylobacterium goesingense]